MVEADYRNKLTCKDFDIQKITKLYLEGGIKELTKNGWEKITKIVHPTYKNHTENEYILKILGIIRQWYINKLFLCAKNKHKISDKEVLRLLSFGSTSITSDYDVSVVGKNAPIIVWEMVENFFKQYNGNKSLGDIFDTNLYVGYYDSTGITKQFTSRKEYIDMPISNLFTIQPIEINDKLLCLQYACIKLIENDINVNKFNNVVSFYNKAKAIQQIENYKLQLIKYPYQNKKYKLDYQKYKLMTVYANDLMKIFYENNKAASKRNLFQSSCATQYHSIDGYYTQCTLNVVVFEIQKGEKNLKLHSINYLCSVIENLGDFNKVMKNISSEKKYIEKLSKSFKYLYRIYYSLKNIRKNDASIKSYFNILDKLLHSDVKQRGLNAEELKLLKYKKGEVEKFTRKITNNILSILNMLLKPYNTGNIKKKTLNKTRKLASLKHSSSLSFRKKTFRKIKSK